MISDQTDSKSKFLIIPILEMLVIVQVKLLTGLS